MRKYVILRSGSRPRRGLGIDSLEALQGDSGGRSIDTAQLEQKEALELRREQGVVAITPTMPIKLIEPKSIEGDVPSKGGSWGIAAVGADRTAFEGAGVSVAVLDTGIDASHQAFREMQLDCEDFTSTEVGDRNGHGTHCAGTIFGRDVGGIRIGIARRVERALIGKVLDAEGRGQSEMMFDAMNWAIGRGVNVISMSVGFDFPGLVAELITDGWPPDLATSTALEAYRGNLLMFNAIMASAQAGVHFNRDPIVIAAAGNESRRGVHRDYRIAATVPAASASVVAVAALGQDRGGLRVADFSNSQAEVSAPGVAIVSAALGGGLKSLSGTSMACPHVAGAAVLWWEALRAEGSRAGGANVHAKVIASARVDGILDADEADVGLGLISCP